MKYSLLFLLLPFMWPSEIEKNPAGKPQSAASRTPFVEILPSASLAVRKEEPIRQVFYHPLIAYPELAFDGDEHQEQMDAWFVTTSEFLASMEAFHKGGFVLVDIREAYGMDGNGRPMRKALALPPGKSRSSSP